MRAAVWGIRRFSWRAKTRGTGSSASISRPTAWRRKPYPEALLPTNMVLVRADLVDYWRLLCDAGVRQSGTTSSIRIRGPRSATSGEGGMPTGFSVSAEGLGAARMPHQLAGVY